MSETRTPSVGMEFDSVDEAWQFWVDYGKKVGFGVRKQYLNKREDSSIRSCRFVCCKEDRRRNNPKSFLVKKPKAETRNIFQDEFSLFLATCIRERNISQLSFEYVITLVNGEGEWKVVFDPILSSISCSCRKFETFGIICCHALKIFEANDVKQYILKRWTRDARSGIIHDIHANEVVEDFKLSSSKRYRHLCYTMVRLAADVSTSEKLHQLVEKGVHDLCKKVAEVRLQENMSASDEANVPVVECATQAKGFKDQLLKELNLHQVSKILRLLNH